ncbi:MAG: metallophosphoesterase, partial [Promethearchaeota archaeon]
KNAGHGAGAGLTSPGQRMNDTHQLSNRVGSGVHGLESKASTKLRSVGGDRVEISSWPDARGGSTGERSTLTSKSRFIPLAKEYEPQIKILSDCTENLHNEGKYEDFLNLFRYRFEKLRNIFRKRGNIPRIIDLADLEKFNEKGREVNILGMIKSKKVTKAGNLMLSIEDLTGEINVIISTRNFNPGMLQHILVDDVLHFKGIYQKGIFLANEFNWPDIPNHRTINYAEDDLAIALISDVHVGSDNHLRKIWNKFSDWIKGKNLNEKAKKIAGQVKYISIAGDLIDGVGIYPTQEDHLLIKDIYSQFEEAARLLEELPDYITIIISPGSHEPVRRALPQPAIPKSYAKPLYDLGAVMVGDPATVETHGIKNLIFHGESFIDLSMDIPDITNEAPETAMKKLLKSRHLCPTYGKQTEIAPDRKKDWLVIDIVPDIFHTGHVHQNGVSRYKDTWLINSGCFQGQTDFMKTLGIEPSIGKPHVINLKDLSLFTVNLI